MTTAYDFEPNGDARNDGWSIVGAQTSLNATFSSKTDTNYISSPASKGIASVSFPDDLSALPAGAVIQSISIMARVMIGAGSPPAGQAPSVTFSMQPNDHPQCFTAATVFPTGVKANYEVATYTRDPTGAPWDIHRLNQLVLRVYSYGMVADLIRVYQLYANINYTSAPTVTVTGPTGTLNTAAPTITWYYEQVSGDVQVGAEYRIFTAAQVNVPGFSPTIAPPVYDGFTVGDVSSVTIPTSLPSDTYWVYVQSTSERGAVSSWTGRQFTLNAPSPGVPGVPNPAAGAPPGQAIVSIVPDAVNGRTVLTLQDTSNLVGTHMASVELPYDNESWTTTNCSIALSSAAAFPGTSNSWAVTAAGSGNATVMTGYTNIFGLTQLTAMSQTLAAATGRNVEIDILYYDSSYTYISTKSGVPFSDATTPWTDNVNVDIAVPSNAQYCRMSVEIFSCAASEVHYLDYIGVLAGSNTPWSSGGQASTNLLDAWYSNCEGSAPAGDAWVPGAGTSWGTSGSVGTAGFDGATCNTLTYTGVSSSTAWRAAGTAYTATSSGNTYTLNKPGAAVAGDLMIAYVTSTVGGTIIPPVGWNVIDSATTTTAALYVLARTMVVGDTGPWSGTFTVNATRRSAVVTAYSGAATLISQFISEGTSTDLSAPHITTASVLNTDPNAWRVSAFFADDPSSAGTWTANTQPPTPGGIQFVSAAPSWGSNVVRTTNPNYTINRPPGIMSGDLMIATVAFDATNGIINAPSGWTMVETEDDSALSPPDTGGSINAAVMMRTAGASEPASWTSNITTGGSGFIVWGPRVTECVAYRNCAIASSQFVAQAMQSATNPGTMYTPTVTNTNGSAWRVCAFMGITAMDDQWSTNEAVTRCNGTYGPNYSDYDSSGIAIADSNGPVSSGSYAMQAVLDSGNAPYAATAWIGFLNPLTTGPTPPPNETSRAVVTEGSAGIYGSLDVFDSNGVVTATPQSVTATYSNSSWTSGVSWVGIIRPATPSTANAVSASLNSPIDISLADPTVLDLANNQVTINGSFIGSSAGAASFTALFYRANVLTDSLTQVAGTFGPTSGAWSDASAVFDIPDGTTRISMSLAVPDRNVSDIVYYDRMSLSLGGGSAYRTGTAYPAHPIWSYPEIQCSDNNADGNGFGPWVPVPGTQTDVPSFGEGQFLVFSDHTIVPLLTRKYRARTVSYGLAGDTFTSPWGPESDAVTFIAQNWWLKDISNPSNNLMLKVKFADMKVAKQNTAVQFQALGEDYPVILTEGFKSDTFTLSLIPVNLSDYALFMDMMKNSGMTGSPLFLQSDIDQAWWVLPIGEIDSTVLATNMRQSSPQRTVDVTFLEVGPTP